MVHSDGARWRMCSISQDSYVGTRFMFRVSKGRIIDIARYNDIEVRKACNQ